MVPIILSNVSTIVINGQILFILGLKYTKEHLLQNQYFDFSKCEHQQQIIEVTLSLKLMLILAIDVIHYIVLLAHLTSSRSR